MAAPRIVVLGMLTKMPVPGAVWQAVHYLVGFERLGYESWYVEAHGAAPLAFCAGEHDLGTDRAAAWLERSLAPFGLARQWAYHALHDGGRVLGASVRELADLYASAEVIINLHGGTVPREEHVATGRLVYLETDPVHAQVRLYHGDARTEAHLDAHAAYFSFGECYGRPDCEVPVDGRYRFMPTRQPVVLDLWSHDASPGEVFTTVGNWRQSHRDVTLAGRRYTWSKHHQWLKVLGVPERTGRSFELTLTRYRSEDEERLRARGWCVRSAASLPDTRAYQQYIESSLGEFTVAKEQNVALRTGWFSDRSAAYLAAGRPVVTEDTGFGAVVPTGEGLLAFTNEDEAVGAVEAVAAAPRRHGRAAREVAREYFDAVRVLGGLLDEVGL